MENKGESSSSTGNNQPVPVTRPPESGNVQDYPQRQNVPHHTSFPGPFAASYWPVPVLTQHDPSWQWRGAMIGQMTALNKLVGTLMEERDDLRETLERTRTDFDEWKRMVGHGGTVGAVIKKQQHQQEGWKNARSRQRSTKGKKKQKQQQRRRPTRSRSPALRVDTSVTLSEGLPAT
jgi:hypothetical protein